MRPIFVDQVPVLADSRLSRIGSPASRGRVAKADVHVRVMIDFRKFVGGIVGYKA
jgi:hypothetical protein